MRCRFGASTVNATFVDASLVLCTSPPMGTEGVSIVQISLTGQEYYGGIDFLYYARSSRLLTPKPASKGRDGGGTLTVELAEPIESTVRARSILRCSFEVARCGADDTGGPAQLPPSNALSRYE